MENIQQKGIINHYIWNSNSIKHYNLFTAVSRDEDIFYDIIIKGGDIIYKKLG